MSAYTMAKYGMSLCVLAMAREFRADGIAVNALWPRTTIATAAIPFALGGAAAALPNPEIVAEAAHGHPDQARRGVHRPLPDRR